MFPYSEQVQDCELYDTSVGDAWQAIEMVFINFWNIEPYGASFGDDIDAKMNYFKHIKWFP